jgi:catechol 2,3-dioxygenase-like lactoylglutathione lyase family enzyme
MPTLDIHHVAIKAVDLEATERFYTEVLGMTRVARPNFDFPGTWLQMGATMFHLMSGYAARAADGSAPHGSAAVDHLALRALGFDEMKARIESAGLDYSENEIPGFGIWQLFMTDPNGIRIELNFDASREPAGSRGPARASLSARVIAR